MSHENSQRNDLKKKIFLQANIDEIVMTAIKIEHKLNVVLQYLSQYITVNDNLFYDLFLINLNKHTQLRPVLM